MPPLVSSFDEPTARQFDDASMKEFQPEGCTIRFNMECIVHTVPDVNDFTEEEIENMWFSAAEFKKLKSKRRVLERMMLSGRFQNSDNSDDYCFRGIETAKDREFRHSRRQQVGNALFTEQGQQTIQGKRDPERLRNALLDYTTASAGEALERARSDFLAIREEGEDMAEVSESFCLVQIEDLHLEELANEEHHEDNDLDDISIDDCLVDSMVLASSPRKQRKGLRRLIPMRSKRFFVSKNQRKD